MSQILSPGPEQQAVWLPPVDGPTDKRQTSTRSSTLFSLVALIFVLAVLTPLSWDALWVAPVAAIAALVVQFMTPASVT